MWGSPIQHWCLISLDKNLSILLQSFRLADCASHSSTVGGDTTAAHTFSGTVYTSFLASCFYHRISSRKLSIYLHVALKCIRDAVRQPTGDRNLRPLLDMEMSVICLWRYFLTTDYTKQKHWLCKSRSSRCMCFTLTTPPIFWKSWTQPLAAFQHKCFFLTARRSKTHNCS